MKASCYNCIHWKKLDLDKITWLGSPPDYDCDISDIESQWPNPRKIIEAALVSRDKKVVEVASQCSQYQQKSPSGTDKTPSTRIVPPSQTFFRDAAEDLMVATCKLVAEHPELNHGYQQGTGIGVKNPGDELNN